MRILIRLWLPLQVSYPSRVAEVVSYSPCPGYVNVSNRTRLYQANLKTNLLEHYLVAHRNKQRPIKMSRNQGKLSGRNKSVLWKKQPCKGATVGTYSSASSGDSSYHRSRLYQHFPHYMLIRLMDSNSHCIWVSHIQVSKLLLEASNCSILCHTPAP